MTKDEFKQQFKRLCEGFKFEPTPGQIEAFYERVGFHDGRDWRETVTDLLCAPRFPKDLNVIADTIGKRADDRRRREAEQNRMSRLTVPERAAQGYCDMPDEVREALKRLGLSVSEGGRA